MQTENLIDQALINIVNHMSTDSPFITETSEVLRFYIALGNEYTDSTRELETFLKTIMEEQTTHGYYNFLRLKSLEPEVNNALLDSTTTAGLKESSGLILNQAYPDGLYNLFVTDDTQDIKNQLENELQIPKFIIEDFVIACGSLGFYQAVLDDFIKNEQKISKTFVLEEMEDFPLVNNLVFISPIHNMNVLVSNEDIKWADIYRWGAFQFESKAGELLINLTSNILEIQCSTELSEVERQYIMDKIITNVQQIYGRVFTIRVNKVEDFLTLER